MFNDFHRVVFICHCRFDFAENQSKTIDTWLWISQRTEHALKVFFRLFSELEVSIFGVVSFQEKSINQWCP